ncbi:MAG: acyltransferase [Actinomycetota bacterium]|nr:acyltransferase [Actinomycetota bacterium]MDQ6945654.1 acyltransferase [Actinomycetota bacterium]
MRGLAAPLVVVQHVLALQSPAYEHWTHDHIDLGRVGVVAFFLVSGYVIPLSLSTQSVRTFLIRRFFRLFPVYWVAFAAYVLIAGTDTSAPVSATVVILNVVMVEGLLGGISILPPAWTLSIELAFYAQAAAAKLRRVLDLAVYAGFVWLGLYLLMSVVERVLRAHLPVTLPMLLFTAALGHSLQLRDADNSRVWRYLLAAGVVIVPAGAFIGIDPRGDWPPFTYSVSFLVGLALFLGFYFARRIPAARALVWLGAISYAMYLVHPTVMAVVRTAVGPNLGLVVLGNVVLVPIIAWLIHRLIEQPSIALGRRLSRKPAGHHAAA